MVLINEIKVDREKYFIMHLNILNATIQIESKRLVNKEIEVLAAFMSLDKNITKDDMSNSLARNMVKESLDNMSAGGLSNHLRTLIAKGYLVKDDITNKITMIPAIIPDEPIQHYQIKLKENEKPI